jgi:hypothetical protein
LAAIQPRIADHHGGGRARPRRGDAVRISGRRDTHLLATLERAGDNLLLVEEVFARTGDDESPLEAGAPPAAGGAL